VALRAAAELHAAKPRDFELQLFDRQARLLAYAEMRANLRLPS